ncbi:glutaminyl-peptide cyclotransferase [Streptococcus halichoeri]|uniref:glutaminyl-peptide cyclotransferase n=1 Tax=Streptococcus halichoeri TaxID=254785 RepID=UPI001359E79E|nr:glutaminyl-peptide cyclotransferase [Streptococcus halichoeri]
MMIKGQVQLVKTYAYSEDLYTQGIEQLTKNTILISVGRYSHSRVGVYQLDNESFQQAFCLSDQEFAEGLTIVGDSFWLLTFKEGLAYRYDKNTFSLLQTATYEGEGWGLAYDHQHNCLWMTSGNAFLQKRDPNTFALLETIQVSIEGVPISMLNELEYVDGYLYANIWQTHTIVKIQPQEGRVVAHYDLSDLLESQQLTPQHYPNINVLNGIAHLKDHTFLLSGKLYPKLLEVNLLDE